jgi:conjugal transfer/type IV secretion protein DotA/TraY
MSPAFCKRLVLCALFAMVGLSVHAYAQTSLNPASIMSSTPSGDVSQKMLNYVFGTFSQNPFALSGTGSTLLGKLFLYLNTFIFFMAALWSTYTITGGIVNTAHEGEFLGKRYSTVWYPIRLVWGAATLVPIFGGFSLGQAIFMFLTLLSIGGANSLSSTAVSSMNDFTSMVSAPTTMPAGSRLGASVADQMFRDYVCLAAMQAEQDGQVASQAGSIMSAMPIGQAGPTVAVGPMPVTTIGLQFGSPSDPTVCGTVSVSMNNGTVGSSLTGFSVNSVNYQGITQSLHQATLNAHSTALSVLSASMANEASTWFGQYQTNKTSGTPLTPYPTAHIAQAVQTYNTSVQQGLTSALQSGNTQAFTSQALQEMQTVGWAGLGAWYETFAEANSAIADASKVEFSSAAPTASDTDWEDAQAALQRAANAGLDVSGGAGNTNETGVMARVMRLIADHLCASQSSTASGLGNATGNVSLGQCLVGTGNWWIFGNSGGNQLVDPIIASKNLGDYLMTSGEVLWGTGELTSLGGTAAQAESDSLWGEFAGLITGGGAQVAGKTGGELLKQAGSVLTTLAAPLLAIGMVMSIYIPLIPFITWFSGLTTWLAVIVESIIASPIWSMAHAEGDGEGMGRRSEHGYLFLLNVMFRAPLMVVAFFVAAAATVIMGTVLFMFFGTAIANAAGNSMVGLLSIGGNLIILCGMMILIVQTSFNLIHIIPDQVLGWIGGNLGATLGRELEGRTHSLMVAGVKHVQTGMASLPAAVTKQQSSPRESAQRGEKQ